MAKRKISSVKVPYGISNYEVIREENYLYVDKTRFIEKLEHINILHCSNNMEEVRM